MNLVHLLHIQTDLLQKAPHKILRTSKALQQVGSVGSCSMCSFLAILKIAIYRPSS